jgi:hypothetical protein
MSPTCARHGLCYHRRATPELGAELSGRDGLRMGKNYLHPRPVRRRAALLRAPSPQDLGAPFAGDGGQLLGSARLADARLAHEHDEPPAPGKRVIERRGELRDLALAASEKVRAVRSRLAGWPAHDGTPIVRARPAAAQEAEISSSGGRRSR